MHGMIRKKNTLHLSEDILVENWIRVVDELIIPCGWTLIDGVTQSIRVISIEDVLPVIIIVAIPALLIPALIMAFKKY